jgi:signal transduction histidine kinase
MEEIFHIQQSDLQKIRQQERLQLAHDLHDIVGGSLIRSISIVSQSQQNLSNQQFLSMLKLLEMIYAKLSTAAQQFLKKFLKLQFYGEHRFDIVLAKFLMS